MNKQVESQKVRQLKAQIEAEMQTLTPAERWRVESFAEFLRWRRNHKTAVQGG